VSNHFTDSVGTASGPDALQNLPLRKKQKRGARNPSLTQESSSLAAYLGVNTLGAAELRSCQGTDSLRYPYLQLLWPRTWFQNLGERRGTGSASAGGRTVRPRDQAKRQEGDKWAPRADFAVNAQEMASMPEPSNFLHVSII